MFSEMIVSNSLFPLQKGSFSEYIFARVTGLESRPCRVPAFTLIHYHPSHRLYDSNSVVRNDKHIFHPVIILFFFTILAQLSCAPTQV